MPFTTQDAKKHNKNLTPRQRRQWAHIANSARAKCIEDGEDGKECDAKAIIQANGAVAKPQQERDDSDYPINAELIEETIRRIWKTTSADIIEDEVEQMEEKAEYVTNTKELKRGLYSLASFIREQFHKTFGDDDYRFWIEDVYVDHPELGNSLIVADGMNNGCLYQVAYGYSDEMDAVSYAVEGDWVKVRLTYVPVSTVAEVAPLDEIVISDEIAEAEITESWTPGTNGGQRIIIEEKDLSSEDRRLPLTIKVKLIQPGFGNSRDNHYYPAEMLKENAGKFTGVKMYITDHRPDEMSERTEVAEIDKVEVGADGSPIGSVVIFDPGFAEKTRNRAIAKKLNTLECSIRAKGTSVKGTVNGKQANIVKEFTDVLSVDFVTRAGAGGQALEIQETYKEVDMPNEIEPDVEVENEEVTETEIVETEPTLEAEPEIEPVAEVEYMTADEVHVIVSETRLPDVAKVRLEKMQFVTAEQVREAITSEVDYLSKVTGAGKPTMLGGDAIEQKAKRMTAEESQEWFTGLLSRHGVQI